MMRLAGSVVIVTGGGRGIGKTLAVGMAREGASIVLAEPPEEDGIQVQKEIDDLGATAMMIPTDISNEHSVHSMVNQCRAEFGHVDILINGASLSPTSSVERITEEEWDQVIERNLVSFFLCSKAVTPLMLAQRSGRIISVASDKAFQGTARGAHYAASQAGIIGFTKALALELAPYGVTANVICPSMAEGVQPRSNRTAEELRAKVRLALGHAGRPEDVIGAAIFLACSAGGYVTGQTLLLSGGPMMW